MSDVVERLQGSRTPQGGLWPYPNLHDEAADEITRLREENARLREALKPFVDAGHFKVVTEVGVLEEHNQVSIHVKESDLRAAAAAIRETGK